MGRFDHSLFEQIVGIDDDDDPHGGRMGVIDRGMYRRRGLFRGLGRAWWGCVDRCGGGKGGLCGGCTCKYACCSPVFVRSVAAAFVVALAVAVIMAVVYEEEQRYIGLPSDWSGEPDDVVRFEAIRDRIVDEGVSSLSSTADNSGPQHRSLRWLTDWDLAQLEIDDPFLIQRYVLGVFFFSTMTADDALVDAKEGGSSSGAAATRKDYGGKVKPIHGWDHMEGWMTGSGHCAWRGVRCHHRPGTDVMDTVYDGNGAVTALNLTMNKLRGRIPSEIGALRDMRVLDLGQNGIEGKIPRSIGGMEDLVTLYLGDNDLSGTIPTEVGMLTECTHLYLDQNMLEGSIPIELNGMVSLSMLGLYENYLSGTIPDLSNLSDLRDVYLDDNDLTGTIPPTLAKNHPDLRDLRVSENALTGSIPPEIGDLDVLNILYVHTNSLTGPIPRTIYKLRELDEFHAHKNKLSGPLPMELGKLKDLDSLYLDHNELSGSIPPTFGDIDDLERMYLHNNNLTGSIPTHIVRLDDLTHLRINDNALTGPIPTQNLEKMYKLQVLHLHNNNLDGGVPEELGLLKYIEEIDIHGNQLSGTVPEGVCRLRTEASLEELQADCGDGADPEVHCECCTACFD